MVAILLGVPPGTPAAVTGNRLGESAGCGQLWVLSFSGSIFSRRSTFWSAI